MSLENDQKAEASANTTLIRSKYQTLWRILGAIISLTLFGFACYTLFGIIKKLDMQELYAGINALSLRQLLIAGGLTCLSYLMLTGYDALALRQIGAKSIGYGTTALASFTSYAVSFTLGFPLLTAGAVRLWVYGGKGLSAPKIASLTVIAGLTFWLGMGIILGTSLLIHPDALAQIDHLTPLINRAIGTTIITLTIAYLIFIAIRKRHMNIQGWKLVLPGIKVTLGQIALGVTDVCASGGILFVLLPVDAGIAFPIFIAAYVFAHILGLASHAPGGAGVFETTMLLALHQIPASTLFGAIILYRLFYYIVPFMCALLLLGGYEIQKRLRTFVLSRFDDE